MKSFKVVRTPSQDESRLNRIYNLYPSKVVNIQRDYLEYNSKKLSANVSCQCNIKRNLKSTCRKMPLSEQRYCSPKQIYRYSTWRGFTELTVGSIKALRRKRIRRIYLPETIDRGVGSADLSSYIIRSTRQQCTKSCCYENQKKVSEYVAGFVGNDNVYLVNRKLPPTIQKESGITSPKSTILKDQFIITGSLQKRKYTTPTQVNTSELNTELQEKAKFEISERINKTWERTLSVELNRDTLPIVTEKQKSLDDKDNTKAYKLFLHDSIVQYEHNLEKYVHTNGDKQSKISVDPIKNKWRREYRKIFRCKSKERSSVNDNKPMTDCQSTSFIRRRFKALRCGFSKHETKKESTLLNKASSHGNISNHIYVSIIPNSPSFEKQRYSNTKVYSPYKSITNEHKLQKKLSHKKSPRAKMYKDDSQWLSELGDTKCENVQGVAKLYGKNFNLIQGNSKTSQIMSNLRVISKSVFPPKAESSKKKQVRKFFIFGKKTNNKEKQFCKSKKRITTGRCDVKDGLTIKVGNGHEYAVKESVKIKEKHQEKYENILRKSWLDKCITNTRDSKNSVHILWNNNMYASNSSTVLELINNVYKHTGINFRSQSAITIGRSRNHKPYSKQHEHYMRQDIEAWMIPKIIIDMNQRQLINYRETHNNNKCQRLFTNRSKSVTPRIELVLGSKSSDNSSKYVVINIPEGYTSHIDSDSVCLSHPSVEQIHKIVEYDASKLKRVKEAHHVAADDNFFIDTKLNKDATNDVDKQVGAHTIPWIATKNTQKPSLFRDVSIQSRNMMRCDVVGVGFINQKDIINVKKPILKIEDELSDDESEDNQCNCKKKCKLSESYLDQYCRNWMPSATDMYTEQINVTQHEDNHSVVCHSQANGTKAYPNINENFQESYIVPSSCKTSCCSHCIDFEEENKSAGLLKNKLLSNFKKKSLEAVLISDKRPCPKDSLEVYKRRLFYARNNQKSKWYVDDNESHSNGKAKTDVSQKFNKPCWRIDDDRRKRKQRGEKRVSLPSCEFMSQLVDKLSGKSLEGILTYKGFACSKKGSDSPTHNKILQRPDFETPQLPSKETCSKKNEFTDTKKKLPHCDELLRPSMNLQTPEVPCEIRPTCPPQATPDSPAFLSGKPIKAPPCCACCEYPRKISTENLQHKDPVTESSTHHFGLTCTMTPTPNPQHLEIPNTPNDLHKTKKEFKPNNVNQKNFFNKYVNTQPNPPPTVPYTPHITDSANTSKETVTGLHLKKLPYKKKTYNYNCFDSDDPKFVHLKSQEKFRVQMQKESSNMEEITETINIKVQDEDGHTLYERIDCKQPGDVNECLFLKDVYKNSEIDRLSTPITVQSTTMLNDNQNEIRVIESHSSVDSLIEINFTLKLKQGDKDTEINIENAGGSEINHKKEGKVRDSKKTIYVIQNQTEQEPSATENKKDVNIKIIIKNFKNHPEKYAEKEKYAVLNKCNDGYNKRVPEKFQTASTGYSDIDQNAFSVHKATIDLATSVDRYGVQGKHNENVRSNELLYLSNKETSSNSVLKRFTTDQAADILKYKNTEETSTVSGTKSSASDGRSCTIIIPEEICRLSGNKTEKNLRIECKNHNLDLVDESSNETVLDKKIGQNNNSRRKSMLKNIFCTSSISKKSEIKKKAKHTIREILTSVSNGTERPITSNEFAKELSYGSLDLGYFRKTESFDNYYHVDNELTNNKKSRRHNATKCINEFSENVSDMSSEHNRKKECLCSILSNKLSNSGRKKRGCCCQGNGKRDKEIYCDVRTNDSLLNFKACKDVETQSSQHVFNEINNANLSIRSRTQSVIIGNTAVINQKSIDENFAAKHMSPKIHLPDLNYPKYCGMKSFKKRTLLKLTHGVILDSDVINNPIHSYKRNKISNHIATLKYAADILQLNETKKAVLEIYKERIVSHEGEKIVAKLPKFLIENEYDIINYEGKIAGVKKVC